MLVAKNIRYVLQGHVTEHIELSDQSLMTQEVASLATAPLRALDDGHICGQQQVASANYSPLMMQSNRWNRKLVLLYRQVQGERPWSVIAAGKVHG